MLMHDMNVLLACVNSYCQWAGVKINMGKKEVTGYDYKRKCPLDLSILQLGNGKPKIVMPWTQSSTWGSASQSLVT